MLGEAVTEGPAEALGAAGDADGLGAAEAVGEGVGDGSVVA